MTQTTPITAKKSYKEGCVAVGIKLKCGGWQSHSAKIESTADLTIEQARSLATSLVEQADLSEAKVNAKNEAKARRAKYVEREVAAGRMQIFRGLR